MKFYLCQKTYEYPIATLEIENPNESYFFSGIIRTHNAWEPKTKEPLEIGDHFFASISIKWDACSHWFFHGEDSVSEEDAGSYYHLCGSGSYATHIACIWFAWRVAEIYFEKMGREFLDKGELSDHDQFFDTLYTIKATE